MNVRCLPVLILLLFSSFVLTAGEIILHKKDATAWLQHQVITGHVSGFLPPSLTIFHYDTSFVVSTTSNGTFTFAVELSYPTNNIRVQALDGNTIIESSPLHLNLGYRPFPVLLAKARLEGGRIRLYSEVIANVPAPPLSYEWKAAPSNPSRLEIEQPQDSSILVDLPATPGEYYFTLFARSGNLVDSFKTFVSVRKNGIDVFDVETDKAAWINRSIIYQVTPYIFTTNRKFADIKEKLEELSQLGINTLYLQPVYKSDKGGQGYDVTDFLAVRPDLGTEADLRSLIQAAKRRNMRVLFDMVPNHTSIHHPYAQDKINNKQWSHYFNFYQQEKDSALYSTHYHEHPDGFIYYFWTQLVNLDYNNEEVQRWTIEVCKYWVRTFDIDGYRFDAVWGVNARNPSFGLRLQKELKSLKPDLLLVAEDKAAAGNAYRQGFDAAYDWDKSIEWVSKWAWQYEFDEQHSKTIFNHPSIAQRRILLQKALFSDGDSIGLRLRYLENNDLHRFISNHSRDMTKMAATLLFTLHGLPMLYNGQETGFRLFPYTSGPIYDKNRQIRSYDPDLFDFYSRLAELRLSNKALTDGSINEVMLDNAPGALAFERRSDSQSIVVMVNMSPATVNAAIKLSPPQNSPGGISFTDLLTGDTIVSRMQVNGLPLTVDPYSTRVLMVNSNVKVPAAREKLLTVSPNPADGNFVLNYDMDGQGELKIRIADTNGRVLLKTSRQLPAGRSTIPISLPNFSPGACYINTNDGTTMVSTRLLLINH